MLRPLDIERDDACGDLRRAWKMAHQLHVEQYVSELSFANARNGGRRSSDGRVPITPIPIALQLELTYRSLSGVNESIGSAPRA